MWAAGAAAGQVTAQLRAGAALSSARACRPALASVTDSEHWHPAPWVHTVIAPMPSCTQPQGVRRRSLRPLRMLPPLPLPAAAKGLRPLFICN